MKIWNVGEANDRSGGKAGKGSKEHGQREREDPRGGREERSQVRGGEQQESGADIVGGAAGAADRRDPAAPAELPGTKPRRALQGAGAGLPPDDRGPQCGHDPGRRFREAGGVQRRRLRDHFLHGQRDLQPVHRGIEPILSESQRLHPQCGGPGHPGKWRG